MKQSTKFKIIAWVKRLLKYNEFNYGQYIQTHTSQIHHVRAEHTYPNKELTMQSEDQLKFTSKMDLVDQLNKDGLVKYTYVAEPSREITRIIAEIKVITPK